MLTVTLDRPTAPTAKHRAAVRVACEVLIDTSGAQDAAGQTARRNAEKLARRWLETAQETGGSRERVLATRVEALAIDASVKLGTGDVRGAYLDVEAGIWLLRMHVGGIDALAKEIRRDPVGGVGRLYGQLLAIGLPAVRQLPLVRGQRLDGLIADAVAIAGAIPVDGRGRGDLQMLVSQTFFALVERGRKSDRPLIEALATLDRILRAGRRSARMRRPFVDMRLAELDGDDAAAARFRDAGIRNLQLARLMRYLEDGPRLGWWRTG